VADATGTGQWHEGTAPAPGDPETCALALRAALIRYEAHPSPAALDDAFAAGAASVNLLRGPERHVPADAKEARWLMSQLPDFERLVRVAVGAAERAAHAAACELWEWFGLHSTPPGWDETERAGARLLVACACAPLDERGPAWLRPRLLRLAARRWSAVLIGELCACDDRLWRRALGERYESVHRRYAPRTRWRTHQLSEVLTTNERTVVALRDRLARWLEQGGDFHTLAGELEAAFVLTRTPAHLA
jgi:hypothetical protein